MTAETIQRPTWRTEDIVVAAVIAAAFGVVFWAWGFAWAAVEPAFLAAPPARYVISGVWLMPAVIGPLVIQRPGAGLFTELVAAIISALLGSVWGLDTILSGFLQGAAAELVFAFTLYRAWGPLVATIAGAAAGVGEWLHDVPLYYPSVGIDAQLQFGLFMVASGALIAGIGSWLLVRSLAQTGVLGAFPSGRLQRRV
ncbi:MAG: ECF transporter S component [Chloroflexota bacterium]|nr:ECF transporter S component [Chloroflexota bacterium]